MYDYIIIGGGITGLYALEQLHKKDKTKSILLLDERNYWGGRLFTHKRPQYEVGGARFNDNHIILLSLIKKYKCHKIPLENTKMFLHKNEENIVIPFHEVNATFETIMSILIKKSAKYSKSFIQKHTMKQWIDFIFKNNTWSSKIIDIFGYDSEITKMNAYDSILSFKTDFISKKFYVLQEGLSELCYRIILNHKDKRQITCKLNSFVENIIEDNETNLYKIKTNNKTYCANKLIIAVKCEQLKQFKLLKPIYPYLSFIHSSPLLRIYAKYNKVKGKVWFDQMPKIVTNSFLRQIIPIDYNSGLIMISYTDGDDIKPFLKNKSKMILKEDQEICDMIQKELHLLFPHKSISKPYYFKTHLWTIGCHHWKPNCDSMTLYKKIKNPLKNIYVLGEAISQKQAWMEGGLETVNDVIKYL